MPASDPKSKRDLLEEHNKVKKKVAGYAPDEVGRNRLIAFVEYVIFPISKLSDGSGSFHIDIDSNNMEMKSPTLQLKN